MLLKNNISDIILGLVVMLKESLVKITGSKAMRDFVTSSKMAKPIVDRFVAGVDIESGIRVVHTLNKSGKRATLDYLGEGVSDEASTKIPVGVYLELLEAINEAGLDANISLKLTQLGLAINNEGHVINQDLAKRNLRKIVERASKFDNFVRIDMECSDYTKATLAVFYDTAISHSNVGVVVQAYLKKSGEYVDNLIKHGVRVRLCKGAYLEPPSVAFTKKTEVDQNYKYLMERLLNMGNFPAIATHDVKLIDYAKNFAENRKIKPNRFEFQMLYGIKRSLQDGLVSDGYGVRVYVPFGGEWYPYLTRRLAERPANLFFFLSNLARY